MKTNIVFLLFFLMALYSHANPIDPQQAMKLAEPYAVDGQQMALRKAPHQQGTTTLEPYYIISRGVGQGYVIVAGDDCIPSIIGYVEQGDFDESDAPPQLLSLLRHYATIVKTLQREGRNTPYRVNGLRRMPQATNRVNIAPLLTSHWKQDSPYNDKVPRLANGNRCAAGCVAIAGGQVFYYWRRDMPDALPATTPTYDFGVPVTSEYQIMHGTPLKWDLMCDSYSNQPSEYRDAVATFVAALGMQTWMEYGESSGAYIWNLPYEMYNLHSKQANKDDGYTDDKWSALIYADLLKGHPLVYSGYNDDWEGHAVVIDGYRAGGDLFHFNYGWGGQGDGYFTVYESGDNNVSFPVSPTVMYDIYPINQHKKVDIELPKTIYAKATNEVTVTVTNRSALPYSGIYLFANNTGNKPTSLTSAHSSDTETVFETDQPSSITLTIKPTADDTCHIFVTDAQLKVLASKTVLAEAGKTQLYGERLTLNGSSATEQHGANTYTVVYNKKVTVTAQIRNESAGGYEGNLQADVYETTDDGETWQYIGYRAGSLTVGAHSTGEVAFNLTKSASLPITTDKLYRVSLHPVTRVSKDTLHLELMSDTAQYFILHETDLAVERYENRMLSLTGHWDAAQFYSLSIANNSTYKDAVGYDLTQVEDIGQLVQTEANPNALFYVADTSTAQGVNVVKGGLCQDLRLTPGYDFMPLADFQATNAVITMDGKVARWQLLTIPFTAQVPDGIIARRIDGHSASGIANRTTDVKTLEAGKTYLMMTSSLRNITLAGADTDISATPMANADTAVVGTYTTIMAPEKSFVLTDTDNQFFDHTTEGTTIKALHGYLSATNLTSRFQANSNTTKDPAYQTLAQNIEQAYHLLDKYRSVVTAEAYETYLAAIQEAEWEFSHRDETTLTYAQKIQNYAAQLLEQGESYMRQVTEVGNMEIDFTSMIKNPSFEQKTTIGWTLTTPLSPNVTASTAARVFANSSLNYYCADTDGSYLLNNHYIYTDEAGEKMALGVGISQTVSGLLPGYYRLTALLASDEGNPITLFADTLSTTINSHPAGKHYLIETSVEDIPVIAKEGEETGEMSIGVKAGAWYKADHFQLTYTGALTEKSSDTDGITAPLITTPLQTREGIYTLQGIRIHRISHPGIYIINGKKVIVRAYP